MMKQELYKMYHRKYFLAWCFLMLLPFLFGIGTIFHLPYMVGESSFPSAFDYCADMQELVKYFYFLVAVYLAGNLFAGEREEGQLQISMVLIGNRKKIIIAKILSYASLLFLFQLAFWLVNFFLYYLGNIGSSTFHIMQKGCFISYAGMFFGYWEMLVLCGVAAILAGMYLKQIHTIVIVYFVWFALRYANELVDLKGIFPEFYADYLMEHLSVTGGEIAVSSFVISGILCILLSYAAILLFNKKDIA
ncbi:hypothetical protein LI221_04035 [Faecalimonas umbilicata]|nr:hypothetical protein [Faecalimonas umbilicata]